MDKITYPTEIKKIDIKLGSDFIYIDSTKPNGQKLTITWSGRNSYKYAFFCIKDAYMNFDDFQNMLQNIDINEDEGFQSDKLYLKKVEISDKKIEILRKLVKTPCEIIMLPYKDSSIIIPQKSNFQNVSKIIKHKIKYHIYADNIGFLGLGRNKKNNIMFNKGREDIPFSGAIAYYLINNVKYPITKEMMLGNEFCIITNKNTEIKFMLNNEYAKYYILKEER